MRKIGFLYAFLVLSLFLICGCSSTAEPKELSEFDVALASWNKLHKDMSTSYYSEESVKKWTKSFSSNSALVSQAECDALLNTPLRAASNSIFITKDQALSDADLLFRLFKSFYGAYEFFGGKETFGPAESKVIEEIKASGTSISTLDFNEILLRNLSFVRDGHMSIGDQLICDYNGTNINDYYLKGVFFDKDDFGFYTTIAEEKHYLVSVMGDSDVANYMKLTINDEGKLCYMILISVNISSPSLNNPFYITSGNNIETKRQFVWTPFRDRNNITRSYSCTIELQNNIPIIEIRGDKVPDEADETIIKPLGDAVKKQQVVILDAMGNLGYRKLFGLGEIMDNNVSCYKLSQTAKRLHKTNMPWSQGTENTYFIRIFRPKTTYSTNLKFVIQDRRNFSALEDTVIAYRSVRNTIFVGGRTGGGQICATNQHMTLPNSRLFIHMGATLSLSLGDFSGIDGVGIEPDIWVNPVDAADAIIRLCKYYNLENTSDTSILLEHGTLKTKKTIIQETTNRPEPDNKQNISSDIISLRMYNDDIIYPGNGFGFGTARKELKVQFNGEIIKDYEFTVENNLGTITKTEAGTLIFEASKTGFAYITITVGDCSATFGWRN